MSLALDAPSPLLPMAILGLLRRPVPQWHPGARWTPDVIAWLLELPEPDVREALELLQLAGLARCDRVGSGSDAATWSAT